MITNMGTSVHIAAVLPISITTASPVTLHHRLQTLMANLQPRGRMVNQLDRGRLLELIARVDRRRCFAKWACDILARDEADRAAEEADLAALFT